MTVVWITGGGSGIGRALALTYAQSGCEVVVSGRRLDSLLETQRLGGDKIHPRCCDVTKENEVQQTLDWIRDTFHRLDVVIANAGYAQSGRLDELSITDWHRQMEVNLFGLVITVQQALPFLEKTGGQVVLMSSVMAYVRFPKSGAYAASKAAVTAFGETLQLELQHSSVDCTIVHPGFIESEIGQIDTNGKYDATLKDKRPSKLMWKASDAACVMKRAIDQRKSHVTITWHGKIGEWFARHAPRLLLWIQGRFMV